MPPAAHLKSLTRVPLSSGASDHNESKTGSQVKAPLFFATFRPHVFVRRPLCWPTFGGRRLRRYSQSSSSSNHG